MVCIEARLKPDGLEPILFGGRAERGWGNPGKGSAGSAAGRGSIMHEPLFDKITPAERESAAGERQGAPVEREVRIDGPLSSVDAIRKRVDGGFYHTLSVVDMVARQIIATGDL